MKERGVWWNRVCARWGSEVIKKCNETGSLARKKMCCETGRVIGLGVWWNM